jgi:hypothetical protein
MRTAQFDRRRHGRNAQQIGGLVEHLRMIEETAKRHLLRLLLLLLPLRRGHDRDAPAARRFEQQLEPLGIAEFGDTKQVRDETLRAVPVGTLKIRAQRLSRFLGALVEHRPVEAVQRRGMAFEQSPHEGEIDRVQELKIGEFPQVLGHGGHPTNRCRCSYYVLIRLQLRVDPGRLNIHQIHRRGTPSDAGE